VPQFQAAEEEAYQVYLTFEDITGQVRVERALRESEERYRLLALASKEAVWDWDLVTDLVAWDEATGPLLDYQPAQLGDTAAWWYDRIHPSDRERVVASMDTAIAQGEPTWAEEYRFRKADGSYALVQTRAHISRSDSGTPARVVGAMAEVTQARRPDQRLPQVLEAASYCRTLPASSSGAPRRTRRSNASATTRPGGPTPVSRFAQRSGVLPVPSTVRSRSTKK
jgi:PAS domain S-box-containing protein